MSRTVYWQVLPEAERWSRPFYSSTLGSQVKERIVCQVQPRHRCVNYATVRLGRAKLCRNHLRTEHTRLAAAGVRVVERADLDLGAYMSNGGR